MPRIPAPQGLRRPPNYVSRGAQQRRVDLGGSRGPLHAYCLDRRQRLPEALALRAAQPLGELLGLARGGEGELGTVGAGGVAANLDLDPEDWFQHLGYFR